MIQNVYFSQRLPLTAAAAVRAADTWYGDLEPVGSRGRWLSAAPRLRLKRGFDGLEATAFDPLVLRRAHGMLWTGGIPVPVELELLQYSDQFTELALHPFNFRWPVGTERHSRLAQAAVSVISERLSGQTVAPVDAARTPFGPTRPRTSFPCILDDHLVRG